MDEWWTVRETADECGVSQDTLRRWIPEGRVRAGRTEPNGRIRIPADEVQRLRSPKDIAS